LPLRWQGRPAPFRESDFGRTEAVALHRQWLDGVIIGADILARIGLALRRLLVLCRLSELRGLDLACWCSLPELGAPDLCHAAYLLVLANR
jgi:hypothetical protein